MFRQQLVRTTHLPLTINQPVIPTLPIFDLCYWGRKYAPKKKCNPIGNWKTKRLKRRIVKKSRSINNKLK